MLLHGIEGLFIFAAAAVPERSPRGGVVVLVARRRFGERSAIHQAVRHLRVRPRGRGRGRGGRAVQGFRGVTERMDGRCVILAVLLLGEAAMTPVRRLDGWTVRGCVAAALLTFYPS